MFCEKCGSLMVVATNSRGIQTYKCEKGCNDCYTFVYTDTTPPTEKVQVREFAYA